MNGSLQKGHDAISAALSSSRPCIVIEMTRQLGDILHSTLVVRHYRKTRPDAWVVWAIGERYVDSFQGFLPELFGPHAIAALPELPPFPDDGPYRVAWVKHASSQGATALGCGVHPWGWKSGNIVDAVLQNAGIAKLEVERRPFLPISPEHEKWATWFIQKHCLGAGYVTLEHRSYSLAVQEPAWYERLVSTIRLPVISLGAESEAPIAGTINGHGTTFRHAKALIARSRCFVGCGSGLSVIAASNGCVQPMFEITEPALSAGAIGYRASAHQCIATHDVDEAAEALRRFMSGKRHATRSGIARRRVRGKR